MKKLYSGMSPLFLLVGGFWAIVYGFNIFYIPHTINQVMAIILAIGIAGAVYLQQEQDKANKRLYWLYPGDEIRIAHVSSRPLLKKVVGGEFKVDYFEPLNMEIWASNSEFKDYCFTPNEVQLIRRSPKLFELTKRAGKPPKF